MKNKLSIIGVLALTVVGLNAGTTNAVVSTNAITAPAITLADTNSAKGMPMELTLGGGGITNPKDGSTEFGLNFTLSAQPLKQPIWFGISQELGWSPSFAGATDLYADWSWRIYKEKLYLNTGWSAGALYDRETIGWRSGPEISLEYYTTGNAFIFAGINYDLLTKASGSGWKTGGDNGIRYSFGIGIAF